MHAQKKTCLHVNISWSIQKEIHLWITPFDKHHLCLSELMCLLCRKVSCFIHQELLLATDVYITWITNAHHCPLLKSFYIIRNQSKHVYLHSLNSKNGNPGCLVKSISYQLTKNFKNWRSPFSTRKPRRSKIPSIFSAPEGSLFIAFSTK